MNIQNWHKLTKQQKWQVIVHEGNGLDSIAICDSLDYFDAVIALTRYLKETENRTRYGMAAVRERLRWDSKQSDGSVLFKINNNLTPDISRILVRMFPELEGFYQVRSIGGDA